MLAGMCKNPRVDTDGPKVAELMADVAAAVSRQAAAVSDDVYEVILREIPELRDDESVLALLASSVHAILGYRMRQYHVGVVCWAVGATANVDTITRLEHAIISSNRRGAGAAGPWAYALRNTSIPIPLGSFRLARRMVAGGVTLGAPVFR